MSQGKQDYEQAEGNPFLVFADSLLKGGEGFREGRERIVEGDEKVAAGKSAVSAGARQLKAGAAEIARGREQLRLAKWARTACAFGAAMLACLSIALGFYWRQSLTRIFGHTAPDNAL